jgi:hypothetical protein
MNKDKRFAIVLRNNIRVEANDFTRIRPVVRNLRIKFVRGGKP